MTEVWRTAVRAGDVGSLERLLRDGADVNARDKHGQTGLMVAARNGQAKVVRLLIEHGAELDHTAKFGLSALMLATVNGHSEIVRLLVKAGANQTIHGSGAPGFFEKTALDLAETQGRVELIEAIRGGPSPAGDTPPVNEPDTGE